MEKRREGRKSFFDKVQDYLNSFENWVIDSAAMSQLLAELVTLPVD